jgi:hypothetical protein
VTIYSNDYTRKAFKEIFADVAEARNESDMMTDYFEKSHAEIFEDNPYYALAREKAEYYIKKISTRRKY